MAWARHVAHKSQKAMIFFFFFSCYQTTRCCSDDITPTTSVYEGQTALVSVAPGFCCSFPGLLAALVAQAVTSPWQQSTAAISQLFNQILPFHPVLIITFFFLCVCGCTNEALLIFRWEASEPVSEAASPSRVGRLVGGTEGWIPPVALRLRRSNGRAEDSGCLRRSSNVSCCPGVFRVHDAGKSTERGPFITYRLGLLCVSEGFYSCRITRVKHTRWFMLPCEMSCTLYNRIYNHPNEISTSFKETLFWEN